MKLWQRHQNLPKWWHDKVWNSDGGKSISPPPQQDLVYCEHDCKRVLVVLNEKRLGKMRKKQQLCGLKTRDGGALPINGLMGMCRLIGSHFHDWTDYNGVAFSSTYSRVTRMGSHFSGILRARKFWQVVIYKQKDSPKKKCYSCIYCCCLIYGRRKNRKWVSLGRENYIYPEVTKIGSIIGHRIWL